MIRKLTLTDFMAHAHTVLELGPGVTVLSGPNNSGKSAVVEALRCLATNPAPKHFIRHGAKEARVEAEFDDGVSVTWVRRKAYALYEVMRPGQEEPETYAKFGRRPPEDVLDILRLNLVDLETGGEVDVHIGNQREPIFLLNQPPSALASFFAASSESAHLLSMQNALKTRVREKKHAEKLALSRMGSLAQGLDSMQRLPEVSMAVAEARAMHDRLEKAGAELPALQALAKRLREDGRRRAQLEAYGKTLGRAEAPPALWPAARLAEVLRNRALLSGYLNRAGAKSKALAPLAPAPKLFDAATLAHIANDLHLNRARQAKVGGRGKILSTLKAPAELFPARELAGLLRRRAELETRMKRVEARSRALADIPEAPRLAPMTDLEGMRAGLAALRTRKEQAARAAKEMKARVEATRLKIEERLAQIGTCPLCGGDIDSGRFLAGGENDA